MGKNINTVLSLFGFLTTREAAWYVISVVSVCPSYYGITFDSFDVGSSYWAHPIYLQ